MYPELFKLGPFTVYSFGLMVGIGFIVASFILTKEFERRKLNPSLATEITLLAIIFGIIGSKVLDLIENWDSFIANPIARAFSPGGLTFYGGLILAAAVIWIYLKKKKIPFLFISDAVSPSLMLAYGIGRIGCQLAGDGDYGIPTSLPWGTNFANGTVKPTEVLRQFYIDQPALAIRDNYHDLSTQYLRSDQYGIITKFDEVIRLHPTPIYEFLICAAIFLILWQLRKKSWTDGKLFMLYLVFSGVERLSVEFLRLNPRLLLGLSEAQLISIFLIVVGTAGFVYFDKHKDKFPKFVPLPFKLEHNKK
jgi:phosphatidylglycerol:prolipoprotein diacylglycerol transferase